MKWHLALCLLVPMAIGVVHAQDTTNTIGHVSIASPNAASLGKYGDIPVSYNTGIPNIGIPIYTAQSGSLKLPVSLSYHASGLKVQENASWVGAGWSLNAGGMITRTVVGCPDDRGVGSYNTCTNGYYSDYGYNSYQWIPGSGFGVVGGMVADDQGFEQGRKDGEPDMFFFNFGSYSGKFYFNDDRTPIFVPEEDFKIQPDLVLGGGNLGFQGFIVTTPDGVKWYFGKTGFNRGTMPIEITTPYTLQNSYGGTNEAVSSWFLNKIVSADGVDSIMLTYHADNYSFYTLSMFPVSNAITGGMPMPNQSGYTVVKNFISGVALDTIFFANGSVTFNGTAAARTDLATASNQAFAEVANTTSKALGSISITDNNGFCKKDSFYYGYFYDATAYTLNSSTYGPYSIHSDQYRLRLDSVQELSCNATLKIPSYKFSYFSEQVPRKLSFGIDHWGYSNGVTTNQTLIPGYTLFNTPEIDQISGAYRDASWPQMRCGSLQQITYPTGGYTLFNFESHDTYCNYNTYSKTTDLTLSDGSAYGQTSSDHVTGSFSTSVSSSTFVIDANSSNIANDGNLEIDDALGHVVQNFTIHKSTGTDQIFYCTLSPSTAYTATLYIGGFETGKGITATIADWVPTAVAGNITVGGLRIKTITNHDAMTPNDVITSYAYTNGGTSSSGILYSKPVYVMPIRNDNFALVYPDRSVNGCQTPSFINPLGSAGTYYLSPGSITPMATVQGNHIGYNQVQVSQTNNGSSIYRYYGSNTWDNIISDVCTRTIDISTCSLTIPNFPAPPQPFEFMRGQLKYEGHFNQNGNILKDATYTYTYQTDPLTTPGIIYITIPGLYSFTGYTLQSAKKTQTQVWETSWDPANSNSISTIKNVYYGSNFHHQPTRSVTFTSTGDSLVTNTKYAADYRIASCDAIPDSLGYYLSTITADSILLNNHISTCTTTDWTCRYDTFQDFRRNVNLARLKFITYRIRSYANDAPNLQSNCYLSALGTADTLLKPILRLQNMFENAPIESTSFKNLNLVHSSFTRYDTSQSPVGYAYPGRTKLINLQATSGTFTASAVSGSTISKDSRYLDEAVYTFSNGNPMQILPHDGVMNSYVWDYLNTQPVAKITNAAQTDIAYTSFEADGKGNWTFIGAPNSDATAPTGNKVYSLPLGAVTKSGLTAATKYVVSYWTNTGTSRTVSGSTGVVQGKTINGWTYFEHTATGVTSISVSGTGSIDELRLYPTTALMTTYTYSPLQGMTASCDAQNRITYYFYDFLGRLKWVKDQDLNIIKTIQYHYQTVSGVFY